MIETISFKDAVCIFAIKLPATDKCRSNHQICTDSCRYEIDHIIKPCRKSAKIHIFIIFVAKHGVHRIHSLVYKAKHRPADCSVKHRCNHSVRCIFSYRLNCRPCDTCRIKHRCISANNHGNSPSSCINSICL